MKIAVIIATRNRPESTVVAIQSILQQSEPPHRIIVVDQSQPKYDLHAFPDVLHIHDTALSGLTAARNRGLQEIGDVDVVFFADDDIEMLDGCLTAVRYGFENNPDAIGLQCVDVLAHAEGRLTAVLGRIFEHGFFRKYPLRRKGRLELAVVEGFGMSFRSSLFRGEKFDENLSGYSFGEDWEFSHRARRHGVLLNAPKGFVKHHRSPLNRHDIAAHLKDRWTHYAYFYRKLEAGNEPTGALARAWWTLGETYKWLRHGLGLPRGEALDTKLKRQQTL